MAMIEETSVVSDEEKSPLLSSDSATEIDDRLDHDIEDELDLQEEQSISPGIAAKQGLQERLQSDVEAFLAKGGKIEKLDSFVSKNITEGTAKKYGRESL